MDSNNSDKREIARLESRIDYLETELVYLNEILIQAGFTDGIKTLKSTVEELLTDTAAYESSEKNL